MEQQVSLGNKFKAKAGMDVMLMMKKGNKLQQKVALIFDANRDGVYDKEEANLFNSVNIRSNDNGDSYSLWDKNTQYTLKKDYKDDYVIYKDDQDTDMKLVYNPLEQYKLTYGEELVAEDEYGTKLYENKVLANGERKYLTKVDVYGRVLERQEPLTIGDKSEDDGFTNQKGNVIKYYSKANDLTGTVTIDKEDSNIETVKDKNNKLLYIRKYNKNDYVKEYVDPKGNRYEISYQDVGDVIITKYDKNGKKVTQAFANILYGNSGSMHEQFKPLQDVLEDEYSF